MNCIESANRRRQGPSGWRQNRQRGNPREATDAMTHDLSARIEYSEKYVDDTHEYRHVILPKEMTRSLPDRLLTEQEWRQLGVQQSRGWVHYAIHKPEPHILLFRRPLGTDPTTGRVNQVLEKEAKEKYAKDYQ